MTDIARSHYSEAALYVIEAAADGGVGSAGAIAARTRPRCRAQWYGQRLPAGDRPDAGPRLHGVGDARKPPPQLDHGRELPTLIEGGADRGGIRLGDDEHLPSMGTCTTTGKWVTRAVTDPAVPEAPPGSGSGRRSDRCCWCCSAPGSLRPGRAGDRTSASARRTRSRGHG
jgi:hypothetical protein